MAFAKINSNLDYWKKQTQPLFSDLFWNIPEQKSGHIAIIGGNASSFATPIKIAESISQDFPLKTVSVILPDALREKAPSLPNFYFAPSNNSGSFTKSPELNNLCLAADATLFIGDLSKNASTAIAISEAIQKTLAGNHPTVITRDTVDLITSDAAKILTSEQAIIVASLAQLQKLFRAVYYPRMLMLSQPLLPILETLHKFTLSYPATVLTLHQNQIIAAKNGQIITTQLDKTKYSPISLWSGQLAARIAALSLYNPNKTLDVVAASVL